MYVRISGVHRIVLEKCIEPNTAMLSLENVLWKVELTRRVHDTILVFGKENIVARTKIIYDHVHYSCHAINYSLS